MAGRIPSLSAVIAVMAAMAFVVAGAAAVAHEATHIVGHVESECEDHAHHAHHHHGHAHHGHAHDDRPNFAHKAAVDRGDDAFLHACDLCAHLSRTAALAPPFEFAAAPLQSARVAAFAAAQEAPSRPAHLRPVPRAPPYA